MKSEKRLVTETLAYIIVVLLLYWRQFSAWTGGYLDSDNYFHVLRIIEFFQHPSYWEQVFPYTNPPFGEVLHWTRAFDLFLAVFTLPFLSVYPLKTAAFYGGLLIAPFFALAAVYAFLKGTRFFLQWKYRLLAALLILVQANVMRTVFFNRPDHHAAFFFLTVFIFWQLTEFICKKRLKSLRRVAVAAAFSLWMAVEGVFLAVIAAAFLMYAYLFSGASYKKLLYFMRVYTLWVIVFWLANPPYEGYFFMDTGRISVFYAAASLSALLILYVARIIKNKWRRLAVIAGFGGAAVGAAAMAGLLSSPIDERIIPLFIDRISEMSGGNFYTMAYPAAGVFCGMLMFKSFRQNGVFMYLLLSLLLYGGLTLYSMRFVPYAGVYAALVVALFIQQAKLSAKAKVVISTVFLLLEYISFIIHVLIAHPEHPPVLQIPYTEIKALPAGVFATDIFFAPNIIWNGGHKVIASPYHRNVEGITDNHEIFHNPDMNEVKRLLCRHHVSYVFLTDGLADEPYYSEPAQNTDKLYGMILSGQNVPEWLTRLPTGGGYLYRVSGSASARRSANN